MVSTLLPIRLEEAVVSKRSKILVGPVSTSIDAGGPTMIIGPNGAGKTTLLRLIHGLERARRGQVVFAEPDINEVRRKQSFVFQKPIMLRRSALDNVIYPLSLRGVPKAEAKQSALAMIERVGLKGSEDTRATFLSGGEAQKLAIARALVTKPDLLLLDEPTASLDAQAMRDIEALIQQAVLDGVEIIMTTHDMGQARRLANNIIFLHEARLLENTEANLFWEKPQSDEARRFVDGEIV
ncbi:MAG: ATP-binding cassette domain-containing protein [Hyphomicrobiales bacterium]